MTKSFRAYTCSTDRLSLHYNFQIYCNLQDFWPSYPSVHEPFHNRHTGLDNDDRDGSNILNREFCTPPAVRLLNRWDVAQNKLARIHSVEQPVYTYPRLNKISKKTWNGGDIRLVLPDESNIAIGLFQATTNIIIVIVQALLLSNNQIAVFSNQNILFKEKKFQSK